MCVASKWILLSCMEFLTYSPPVSVLQRPWTERRYWCSPIRNSFGSGTDFLFPFCPLHPPSHPVIALASMSGLNPSSAPSPSSPPCQNKSFPSARALPSPPVWISFQFVSHFCYPVPNLLALAGFVFTVKTDEVNWKKFAVGDTFNSVDFRLV